MRWITSLGIAAPTTCRREDCVRWEDSGVSVNLTIVSVSSSCRVDRTRTDACYIAWCPIGPTLVSPKALGNVQNLELKTFVNGQLKQSVNTKDMVYSIVSHLKVLPASTAAEQGFSQNPV